MKTAQCTWKELEEATEVKQTYQARADGIKPYHCELMNDIHA